MRIFFFHIFHCFYLAVERNTSKAITTLVTNLIIGKKPREGGVFSTQVCARIYFATSFTRSLRKHPFLFTLRRWGRARRNGLFSQASFTRCLRPLAAKSHYGSCCSLLSLIDLTSVPRAFLLVSEILKINSNNQILDLTRRHFILPHFHPLQSPSSRASKG